MNSEDKQKLIKQRLEAAFQPKHLIVNDDSDKHVGHAGHGGGGRHFSIEIDAKCLPTTRIEAHRKIYQLFTDLMPDEIHALSICLIN